MHRRWLFPAKETTSERGISGKAIRSGASQIDCSFEPFCQKQLKEAEALAKHKC
jgi:hypothetical protein